mmetsp:Transcript_24941/g.54265  ORF Transcript_24941/g.54265 Transcript_24941/m.54265 type:complete len:435 (+) Transcript_24941:49-1353(+)
MVGMIDRWRRSPASADAASGSARSYESAAAELVPGDTGGDSLGSLEVGNAVAEAVRDDLRPAESDASTAATAADGRIRSSPGSWASNDAVGERNAATLPPPAVPAGIGTASRPQETAAALQNGAAAVPAVPVTPSENGEASATASRAFSTDTDGAEGPCSGLDVDLLGERPLMIQADAPLVDGLRALLVHHLKRSVGASIVNLSASQAELLEHHLARLASYAQKIVHTLAFATRFLSKHHFEGDHGELESPRTDGGGRGGSGGYSPGDAVVGGAAPPRPPPEPRPPRKALKLNDDEILSLYRSAQHEASIEADWRGIQGPTPSRSGASEDGGTSRSAVSLAAPASDLTPTEHLKDGDQEYLRMLSRALQQPGRSPRAFTAEILDPSKDVVCCRPRVDTMLNGVMGRANFVRPNGGSLASVAAGGGTLDPSSHRA